jgi:carbamate kinase
LIRLLLASGAIVICAGGGGVPVIRSEEGRLEGVEAVVDKDLTTAVLAEALDADVLLVLTDVAHVESVSGPPRRSRSCEPHLRPCNASTFRPGRWGRRSPPSADSSS